MVIIGLVGLPLSGRRSIIKILSKFNFNSLTKEEEGKGEGEEKGINEKQSKEIMNRWRENYIILIQSKEDLELFYKRPLFLLISTRSSTLTRFKRQDSCRSLETFLEQDAIWEKEIISIQSKATLTIYNDSTLEALEEALKALDLSSPSKWIRLDWDDYFMQMAVLVGKRSNCMKSAVGAVLVRNHRVIATGYNGTPQGLVNCMSGGCSRCNDNTPCGKHLEHCLCLHAEENVLFEAGGQTRTDGATVYVTRSPCLGCAKRLIQCKISRIVFWKHYSVDHDSESIFKTAGIKMDRLDPVAPKFLNLK